MKHLAELYEQALKDYDKELTKRQELEQQCKRQKEVINKLEFIRNRKNQGASQENINRMAIELVDNYLKEASEWTYLMIFKI